MIAHEFRSMCVCDIGCSQHDEALRDCILRSKCTWKAISYGIAAVVSIIPTPYIEIPFRQLRTCSNRMKDEYETNTNNLHDNWDPNNNLRWKALPIAALNAQILENEGPLNFGPADQGFWYWKAFHSYLKSTIYTKYAAAVEKMTNTRQFKCVIA